jgi:O-antigen/teichoic acid export membrane protein
MRIEPKLGKYLKEFSFFGIFIILVKLITFLVETILARKLGPYSFGIISFSLILVSYFSLLLNKGLDFFGIREISKEPQKLILFFSNFYSIRFLFLILATILLIFGIWFIPLKLNHLNKVIISIYGLQLIPLALSLEWLLQALHKMKYLALSQFFGQLIYLSGILYFIRSENNLIWVPIFFIISAFCSLLFSSIVLFKVLKTIKWNLSFEAWPFFFKASIPMGLSVIMATLYNSFDHFLLGIFKNQTLVGLYRADYRLLPVVFLLPSLIGQYLFPSFTKITFEHERIPVIPLVDIYLRVMLILAFSCGFGIAFLNNEIVMLLYGPEYIPAISVLRILGINMTFVLLSFTLGQPLLAWGKQSIHLKIVSIGAMLNLILNMALIPHYDMKGAAIATICAEIVVFIMFLKTFSNLFLLSMRKLFFSPILATCAMTTIIYLAKYYHLHLFHIVLLSGFAYLLTLYFTSYLKPIFYFFHLDYKYSN